MGVTMGLVHKSMVICKSVAHREEQMGISSSEFNQVGLSRTKAISIHSDMYQLPAANLQTTVNLQQITHASGLQQSVCLYD